MATNLVWQGQHLFTDAILFMFFYCNRESNVMNLHNFTTILKWRYLPKKPFQNEDAYTIVRDMIPSPK